MKRNKRLLQLALGILAAAGCRADTPPDGFGYYATSNTTFSFVNVAGTGTRVMANADDDVATVNIGFPFRFYGVPYTSACISSNGLLTFGGCNLDFANADLTAVSPTGNKPAIAVFWDDLTFASPGADGVWYQTIGAPGKRQFVVQWNSVFAVNTTGSMTFEVLLNEADNSIVMQYLDVEGNSAKVDRGAGATTGIRDTDGHRNRRVVQWSVNAPVLANNMAIRFNPPVAILPLLVQIDVKPGGDPAAINLRSKGTLPVAILSSKTFDARTVDPATVAVAGAALQPRRHGALRAAFEDVNKDGLLDLVLHVSTADLQLTDTTVVLTGQTYQGQYIQGSDTVKVIR